MRRLPVVLGVAILVLGSACSGSSSNRVQPGPTSTPGSSTAAPSAVAAAAWPTYHRDVARTGYDPTEPAVSNVHRQWASAALDGTVYAEPLVVGTTVIAATEGDTVYALDAATGQTRWSQHLGTPMAGDALPCGNINPSGITGTPVIDTTAGTVWVLAFVRPGRHELVGLDLATGAIRSRRPADPPGADPLVHQQRGALTLTAGRVYIPYGGLFGDCGNYRGAVVSLPVTGQGALQSFAVPTVRRGGIWTPPGAVVNGNGELLVSTGNTETNGNFDSANFDGGNAVVRLSPDLRQLDVFAPGNWASLNNSDTDLGSLAPSLMAGGLVLQVGKEGIGYLLDGAHLGGVGGQLYSAPVCSGGAYGGTAVVGSTVYVPCHDGLVALQVGGRRFSIMWRTDFGSGSPVVAAGMVWVMSLSGTLYGLDSGTGAQRYRDTVGTVTHFPSVAVGGGQLFVPSGSRVIAYAGV